MSEQIRPGRGNAFMLLLLLFNIVVTLAVSLLYWPLADTPYGAFFSTPWFAMITQCVSFLLPLLLWLTVTGERLSGLLPAYRLGRVNIVLLLALCLCLQPFMMLLSAVSTLFFPNTVSDVVAGWHRYPLMLSMAAIALTPALCEEIIFRGYILSQYNRVSMKKGAFVTGLFFAMMHLNAQQFLYAFVMGVIFAVFVHYTRSIYAGVLAHFCVNAVQLMLHYALESLAINETEIPPAADAAANALSPQAEWLSSVLYLSAVALIFLPAVIILLRTFISHNRQRNTRQDLRHNLPNPEQNDKEVVEKEVVEKEVVEKEVVKKEVVEKEVFETGAFETGAFETEQLGQGEKDQEENDQGENDQGENDQGENGQGERENDQGENQTGLGMKKALRQERRRRRLGRRRRRPRRKHLQERVRVFDLSFWISIAVYVVFIVLIH